MSEVGGVSSQAPGLRLEVCGTGERSQVRVVRSEVRGVLCEV